MLLQKNFKPILSEADIRFIEQDALRVLCEFGVQCDKGKAADLLCEKGKMTFKNGRLLFDHGRTELFWEKLKAEKRLEAQNEVQQENFTMGGSWNCLTLCDPLTNRPRPATTKDVIQYAHLSAALGAKDCPVPITTSDVDPKLRTVTCEMIAVTETPYLGSWLTATNPEEIKIIAAMHKAAGRKYTLGLEGLISPLRLNPVVFDTYFKWCDDPDVNIGIMGGIPVAGTTAPLIFPANLVQALAEAIALDFISDAMSDGKHRCWNLRLELGEMKNANLTFGTPEHCLIIQSVFELSYGLFGARPSGGAFRTNGKVVDAQTVMERMGVFMFQADWGSRRFSSVGQLCIDEVYSPVQAVIDGEILRYAQKLYDGIPASCMQRDVDTIEILQEGVEEGSFLGNPTTFENFRDLFDLNRLAQASFLNTWESNGSRTLEALAWEKAQGIMNSYEFSLAPERRREIDNLYNTAKKLLV